MLARGVLTEGKEGFSCKIRVFFQGGGKFWGNYFIKLKLGRGFVEKNFIEMCNRKPPYHTRMIGRFCDWLGYSF